MTDRLKPTEAANIAKTTETTVEAAAQTANVLDFSPSTRRTEAVEPDAAGLISFAPAPDMSGGPIIIDEEELARDFSSAFHHAAGKRDSAEFPIPDLYQHDADDSKKK